jgi:transcriptional regulator with XRE-family HTH domain
MKRRLFDLQRKVNPLQKRVLKAVPSEAGKAETSSVRFTAKGLRSQRQRLGLSAADYGKLVGVTGQTIYSWEHGIARPRKGQLPRIASLRTWASERPWINWATGPWLKKSRQLPFKIAYPDHPQDEYVYDHECNSGLDVCGSARELGRQRHIQAGKPGGASRAARHLHRVRRPHGEDGKPRRGISAIVWRPRAHDHRLPATRSVPSVPRPRSESSGNRPCAGAADFNKENSHASGTPVTDGERVYVAFRVGDDIVVAAHELASGRQLWLVRPGTHTGEWGFSNEPVLFKDKVILDADSKGDSFLVALRRTDGKTLWRVPRTHQGISYSAPLIREMAGRTQLVQCGDCCVTGFDLDTGRQLWTVDGLSEEFVATPTYSEKAGLVYISSSWPRRVLFAIRPDGSGNVTRPRRLA